MKSWKIDKIIWWLVTGAILAGTVYMYMDGRGTKGLMGILTLVSLGVLGLWQKKFTVQPAFLVLTYLFILVSVGFGTFGGAYSIKHFDDFLHLSSGIWLGYGAWLLMVFFLGERVAESMPKPFIAFFIIIFALATAGAWELLEFAGDKLLHFTAQGRDPDDTMFDMIDGLVGGTIIALIVARKHGKTKV
ncbi:MAG: hypothetical protein ACI4XL_08945 [Bacillus sp. (in: firmicutes)]